MARKDALFRLHQQLVAQREELRRKLSVSSEIFSESVKGDFADQALHDVERELESQLASFESRELVRIEKAIEAIQNGTYGQCEVCGGKIPVMRLRALPHTSSCIECQRKYENRLDRAAHEPDWESAWEFQAIENDRELTLRDIHIDGD